MAVETALYIAGLNSSYPAGSEFVAQGDEHICLIKLTLQNTFPGLTRAIDSRLIPMSTYPASPDATSIFDKFAAVDNSIAGIETYLYANPLGDALRQANNLSDVGDVSVARANLSVPEASTVLLRANDLSDVASVAQARINLSVPEASTVMLKAANLGDVVNVAAARTNLGVPATADVLLKADNLASVASAATARTNLGAAADADVLKKANNLSDILSASSARTNLGVYSTAQTDSKIAADIAAALATISLGSFNEKNASFTFTAREDVKVDVSGGAVTATLETSPAVGAYHLLAIGAGDVAVNNITISPNSELFDGVVADQVISEEGIYLIYWKSTANGWTMVNLAAGGVSWAEYNNGAAPAVAPSGAGSESLALGTGATVGPSGSYSFTLWGTANQQHSIAMGLNSTTAGGSYALAIGNGATGSGDDLVVIGRGALATTRAVAIGRSSNGNGADAVSIGYLTSAFTQCVAIGYDADANSGAYAIAIGPLAKANATYGISLGHNTIVSQQHGLGLGSGVTVSGLEGTAVGRLSQATATYANAFGNSARANHAYSTAIGLVAYTQWANQVKIGAAFRPQSTSWDGQAGISENSRRVDTTDATPYSFELAARGTGTNQSAYLEVDAVCHETSTGEMWHQKLTALLKGGSVVAWSVIGAVVKSTAITSGGLTVSIDLDLATANQIKLQVTGEAGKTLTWNINARILAKVA